MGMHARFKCSVLNRFYFAAHKYGDHGERKLRPAPGLRPRRVRPASAAAWVRTAAPAL